MKVRLKVEKILNGKPYLPGWVIGVDQSTAEKWIAAGEAVQVQDDVRTLKYAEGAPVMQVCVDPNSESPAEKGASKAPPAADAKVKH